jgi:multidrug efflux pump subunit AcrB
MGIISTLIFLLLLFLLLSYLSLLIQVAFIPDQQHGEMFSVLELLNGFPQSEYIIQTLSIGHGEDQQKTVTRPQVLLAHL